MVVCLHSEFKSAVQHGGHGCAIGVLNGEKGNFSKHCIIKILLYG